MTSFDIKISKGKTIKILRIAKLVPPNGKSLVPVRQAKNIMLLLDSLEQQNMQSVDFLPSTGQ